jgi:hypothetical protein
MIFVSDVATDVEKPSTEDFSSDINKMSTYSAQLIVAVAFQKVVFRSLSYKDMVKAAKLLGVKSRGIGKYNLAQKMAIQLVEQKYVKIAGRRNFLSVGRDDITLMQEIQFAVGDQSPKTVQPTSSSECVDETQDVDEFTEDFDETQDIKSDIESD